MNKKILDIGCGINKSENVIGMDISNLSGADIIHDINKYPYPFDDENFDEIICSDTFILVNNPIEFLREVSGENLATQMTNSGKWKRRY